MRIVTGGEITERERYRGLNRMKIKIPSLSPRDSLPFTSHYTRSSGRRTAAAFVLIQFFFFFFQVLIRFTPSYNPPVVGELLQYTVRFLENGDECEKISRTLRANLFFGEDACVTFSTFPIFREAGVAKNSLSLSLPLFLLYLIESTSSRSLNYRLFAFTEVSVARCHFLAILLALASFGKNYRYRV